MIRIVLTADNHLGRYYAKMSRDQLIRRRRRIRQAWRESVEFALKIHANFYLQCGDLFDSSLPSPGEMALVAREFQRLADNGVKVLAIPGNHDMPRYLGESAPPSAIFEELRAARVFMKRSDLEFETFEIEGCRVVIAGLAPDPRADASQDPLEGLQIDASPADVKILMLHGGVEGTVPEGFGDAVIHKSSIAALSAIDYFFVGDIHQSHKLTVENSTVLIPGSTERMNFGELKQDPGFYYLELDGKQPVKLVRKAITPQSMRRIEIRSTDIPQQDPTEWIFDEIKNVSNKEQLVQLEMEGPLDRETYHSLRFFDIWRLGDDLNFFFDLNKTQIELRSKDHDSAGMAPEERVDVERELERVADEMQAEATSEEARARIADASARVQSLYRGNQD